MALKDAVSGFYGDVPYCSPIESSVFFDTITASRMHRLPEGMMSKADSISYFMSDNSNFRDLLFRLEKEEEEDKKFFAAKGGGALEIADIIPGLFHSPSSHRLTRESDEGNCFVVVESKGIGDLRADLNEGKEDDATKYVVLSLDLKSMDFMWQSLLSFLLGGISPEKNLVFVLPSVDIYLEKGNSYGEFLFSLWALSLTSILHHFASISIESIRQRLNRMSIKIGVSEGHEGDYIADDIHLFFENKLRVCVYRILSTETLVNDVCTAKPEGGITTNNRSEWLEKATELIVGIHEEICDEGENESEQPGPALRCILFIIPEMDLLRNDLQSHLSDSYTSTPVVVARNETEIRELLCSSHDRTIPVVFFSSLKRLKEQLLKPEHERYLNHLLVKTIFYSESDSYGRDIAVIRMLFPGSSSPYLLPYPAFESVNVNKEKGKVNNLDNGSIQEAINIILWLFRRFKLDTCGKGIQPVLRISEIFFMSQDAAAIFEEVINVMKTAGFVSLSDSDELHSFRLEVLGRAISYRFCLPYEPKLPELTSFDVRCILWCYAFRQSKEIARKLITAVHLFPSWVEDAIERFCFNHRINLENGIGTEEELIKELSSTEKSHKATSRIKSFLTHPSGERLPISGYFTSAPSTSCRGWFEQAPIGTSVAEAIPKPHVNVYCYPPHNELCEIRFGDSNTLQCPLDLSYPLIITHIVLHTSLWNNAVILESKHNSESVEPLPIPLAVLQSPTLKTILEDVDDGKVGFWLDNCMDVTPPLSDPLELSSLMAKTFSLLGLCNRRALRRKRAQEDLVVKRPRSEASEVSMSLSESEAKTIKEFVEAAAKIGREKAENLFKKKKGFAFLNPSHKNYGYYLHVLEQFPGCK